MEAATALAARRPPPPWPASAACESEPRSSWRSLRWRPPRSPPRDTPRRPRHPGAAPPSPQRRRRPRPISNRRTTPGTRATSPWSMSAGPCRAAPPRAGVAGRDRDLQLGEPPVKRHLPRRERLAQVRERLEREQPHGAPPRDESPRPLAVEGHPRLPVEPPRPVQRPDHDRRTGRRPEEAGRVEAVERPGYPPQQREVGRDRTREDDDVGDAPVVWGGDATDRSLKLQQRSAAGVFALALTPVVVALLTSSR